MIEAIFITEQHREQLQHLTQCSVVSDKGIVGDRYFDKQLSPGQNISFISLEAIEHYNQQHQQNITAEQTRRNIITKGVDLNSLVDKEFTIGDARFKGVELCQPCKPLSQQLANETIHPETVLAAWTDCAGIRATVLSGGELRVAMAFQPSLYNS